DYITYATAARSEIDPHRARDRDWGKELAQRNVAALEFSEVARSHRIVDRGHEELSFNRVELATRGIVGNLERVRAKARAVLSGVLLHSTVHVRGGTTIDQRGQATVHQPFCRTQREADTGAPHWIDRQGCIAHQAQTRVPRATRDVGNL